MTIATINIECSPTMEQPGRMFNKSPPIDFDDAFFAEHHQQRRTMNQGRVVLPYHGMDDIPLHSSSTQPEMKGFASIGGICNSSPNGVADIKHFEPPAAHFVEDDCGGGGVSIDLCAEEGEDNDDDDDDQTYRLDISDHSLQHELRLRDEEPEQQEIILPEPCIRRHNKSPVVSSSSPSSSRTLAPIFEERNVTFAAQHVVLRVDEAGAVDSLETTTSRFVHQVFDAVQVWFIPHHSEYIDEVRASLWYSPSEMALIKEKASEAKKSRRRQQRSLQQAARQEKQQQQQQQQRFEAQLDTCSLFAFDLKMNGNHNSDRTETNDAAAAAQPIRKELSSGERRSLYETMVDAVLMEQYEQRRKCLRVYGRIDVGCTGILDSNRLAEVCATAGETDRSYERALLRAQTILGDINNDNDEDSDDDDDDERLGAKRHRHCDSMELTTTTTKTAAAAAAAAASSAPVRGSKKASKAVKRSSASAFHSSAVQLTVETSQILDQSVASVFRALLSPFLEIRRGDAFLGIGEEMSIA